MSDSDCLFCKIVRGEIPASVVRRDDDIVVIEDVNPQAPKHLLVMPVKHASNLPDFAASESPEVVAKFLRVVGQLGREHSTNGFRAVINTGPDGGQTVDHLHAHVLSGRQMHWPPG